MSRTHELLPQEMFAHPWKLACLSSRTAGRCRPNPDHCPHNRRQPALKAEVNMPSLTTAGGANSPGPRRSVAENPPPPRGAYLLTDLNTTADLPTYVATYLRTYLQSTIVYLPTYHPPEKPTANNLQPTTYNPNTTT